MEASLENCGYTLTDIDTLSKLERNEQIIMA